MHMNVKSSALSSVNVQRTSDDLERGMIYFILYTSLCIICRYVVRATGSVLIDKKAILTIKESLVEKIPLQTCCLERL